MYKNSVYKKGPMRGLFLCECSALLKVFLGKRSVHLVFKAHVGRSHELVDGEVCLMEDWAHFRTRHEAFLAVVMTHTAATDTTKG